MSELMFSRVRAHFSRKALLSNYEVIQALVPGQAILPMIKAGAYGHGASWAARALAHLPGLYGLGVATLEEGREVRDALDQKSKRSRIIVFSGTALWSEEKGQFCEKHGLTATISQEDDWVKFRRGGWTARIPYELKFNTGMNRLGMPPQYARVIAGELRGMKPESHPSGIFSHLALGENPDEKLSRLQREQFLVIRGEFEAVCPQSQFHLANSAAIWNEKLWGTQGMTDVVRPGVSLYGIVPFEGAPARGLAPVMNLEAQVVAIHVLKPGERIGYGGTFKAKERMRVAILAMGYADGLKRALGDSGHVLIGPKGMGERHPIIGIVSMDLCAVSCPDGTRPGDWARILGEGIDPWEQAKAAGTLPYELLTSVTSRVERVYSE
jgi:alanine racemase